MAKKQEIIKKRIINKKFSKVKFGKSFLRPIDAPLLGFPIRYKARIENTAAPVLTPP
ncbi:hypothetical protein BMS3Bbin15_00439 [archaeon BMS3Bbin15]|nr:hypothetical protein BMS3Bbin15_00439 [archaeon BMS3Bbin15]